MMKLRYLFILSLIIITFIGCDGLLIIRGAIIEDFGNSLIVDTLNVDKVKLIGNTTLMLFPSLNDSSSIHHAGSMKIQTDSTGYFSFEQVIGMGTDYGAIIAQKENYYSDTVYFNFVVGKPTTFILKLKPNN
jgi:hypothetical protein